MNRKQHTRYGTYSFNVIVRGIQKNIIAIFSFYLSKHIGYVKIVFAHF